MKTLVTSVQPFHQRTFKSQKSEMLFDDAGLAPSLAAVQACGRQLLMELSLNGQASGVKIEYEVPACHRYTLHTTV